MPIAEVAKVIFTKQGIKDFVTQLTAHVAAVGPLDLCTVGLYKNNVNPTPNTSLVDLGEVQVADWAEYLEITTTGWGAQETRSDGSVMIVATPLLSWTGPAAGGGPTIYGCVVKSPLAGTHFLAALPFAAPVGMPDNTQVLTVDLPFLLGGGPFVI